MNVLFFILSTIFLFASVWADGRHDQEQDHSAVHRHLGETINSTLNIVVVEGDQGFDRRNMSEQDLRRILDKRRNPDRRRRLKGTSKRIFNGQGVRGSSQHQRRVKKGKGSSKEGCQNKDKGKKGNGSKDSKGQKKGKGKDEEDYDEAEYDRCAPQVVYLKYPDNEFFYVDHCDYDEQDDRRCIATSTFDAYQYTQDDKDQVQERLEKMYDGLNIEFTQTKPDADAGDYSTITMECGEYGGACIWSFPQYISILFGSADKIDLMNFDRGDNAFAQAEIWQLFKILDESDVNLRAITDAYDYTDDRDEAYRLAIIRQLSLVVAHELGHLLGLRHHDSFGPPGKGIAPTVPYSDFYPTYEGLDQADETFMHIMGYSGSVAGPLYLDVKKDDFFSARSIKKLLSNTQADILEEADVGGLHNILKFNKLYTDIILPDGFNAGKALDLQELFIKGRIDEKGETDFYRFDGKEGDIISAEFNGFDIFEYNPSSYDVVIGALSLYLEDDDGTWKLEAKNHQNFEGFDAFMVDAVLPIDGTYVMEVYAPDALQRDYFSFISLDQWELEEFRTGDYYVSIYKTGFKEEH